MTTALSTQKPESLADARPVPKAWVTKIFDRLTGHLGSRVSDLYAGADPRIVHEEWGAGLAGYHPDEIARGIATCRERRVAPTLGEFLAMCRPCLDPEWAFYEAADCLRQRDAGEVGNWSHPAVWRAASDMGTEVRGGDWKAHRTRWSYTLRRELAAGWSEIPKPAMRVDHDAKVRGPSDREREALAGLRSMFKPAAEAAPTTE